MADSNKFSIVNGNTLELHYWFKDDSHTMDAFIQNKCELEVLNILKEIAATFEVEITVETEPLAEGGLRKWLKVLAKQENKTAPITTTLIASLATIVLTLALTKLADKLTEDSELLELQKAKLKYDLNEGKELDELEKEQRQLEIEKLKRELPAKIDTLANSSRVKKCRSNFYESLYKYEKVEKVSFIIEDENKVKVEEEKVIERGRFQDFILVNDELPAIDDEQAVIEIISPVLKKGGNYKWTGIYKNEPIDFDMKSNEFKTLVQTGEVNFKNGSSINCHLHIKRRINNEGTEKIVGYEVLRVNNYFQNDQPIETPEGKRHRNKKEADRNQLKMFNEGDED